MWLYLIGTVLIGFLVLSYVPYLRLRYRVSQKHPGLRMPTFVPFSLPYFGNSAHILMESTETFVLNQHKKLGPAFGFYMQDLPFFCLDITSYGKEVNSSPLVARADLPPSLSPISGPTHDVLPVLQGIYSRNLKVRLPFIQKQLEDCIRDEFPDPSQTYKRDITKIFQRLTACFTLTSWYGFDYETIKNAKLLDKVCEYHSLECSWRDITLVMPRLAPLARFRLKKFRSVIQSFLKPLLKLKAADNAPRTFFQILNDEGVDPDILMDTFIAIIPGGMSIGPSVSHLFNLFLMEDNKACLAEAHDEQKRILEKDEELTSTIINSMKYLDATFKETLRLEFTLASYRFVNEDIVLHDNYVLPAGSHFILTGAAVNYDETIFPNAHTWDPQRWMNDDDEGLKANDSRRKDAFIWGSGKVFCPGRQHALFGMKLMTALVLRNFSVTPEGWTDMIFKVLDSNNLYPK